jgi:hypothetical protein
MIILGTKANVKKCSSITIKIGGHTISQSNCIRDLGVWLDSQLSFKDHVNKTCAKAYGQLRLVNHFRRILPHHIYTMLVKVLVLSHTQYSISVLYGVPDSVLTKLQAVVNAALRSIAGLKKFDHISEARRNLGWLSVRQQIQQRASVLIYCTVHHRRPAYLHDLISFSDNRALRSATQRHLSHTRSNTVLGTRAFSAYAPLMWNCIPSEIRQRISVKSFSDHLKDYLLEHSD